MQQHFVADNDRRDRIRIFFGKRYRGIDKLRILDVVVADPNSEKDF